ncbi:MAG: cobalt transporter CbiM [Fimbriimonadaceae bacterium]
MHIPDAYLSPATQGTAFVLMAPVWFTAVRRTREELTTRQAPLLSMGAAFCFAVQMFNIPAVGGTTAHPLGAALLAILVGPWAAVLGMTLTLVIQALLFGDGGILSLGVNCFNMAFVAPILSYGVYRLLSSSSNLGAGRRIASAGIGAYVGIVAASLSAGIVLGIQPAIAHDASGRALYCPFGLSVSVPAMVMSHLLAAGPAEAIITVAALAYIIHSFPEFLRPRARSRVGQGFRLARALMWVMALTPIGLLAGGAAFGEWHARALKQILGYVPAGAAGAHNLMRPLLPDYGFAGLQSRPWEVIGYFASAVVGCSLVAMFTRSVVRRPKREVIIAGPILPALASTPTWMGNPNPRSLVAVNMRSPWLERSLLRMRSTIAKAVASELVARSPGLLQLINPFAKTASFLAALIAVSLASAPASLVALLLGVGIAAWQSHVPPREFWARVGGGVLFFGVVLAVPVSLQVVTPGPTLLHVLGAPLSATGLQAATLILLRLACGMSLAILWHLTTRWHDLLRTLRVLTLPEVFITTATLAYRYLFVMIETLSEMVEARTARQVGACDKRQAHSYVGAGTAVLFAKSLTFTEEMHWAMISRDCDSKIARRRSARWNLRDHATVLAGMAALTLVLLERSHVIV